MEIFTKRLIERPEAAELKSDFNDLVVFTTTLYGTDRQSEVRQKLAQRLFENCEQLGMACVVVDGGSNQRFIEKASSLKHLKFAVNPQLGMGQSRREALRIAMENFPRADFFLWLEPEKDSLVSQESLNAMLADLRTGQADIVVPKRKSKATLPALQSWIETRANRRAGNLFDPKLEEELDLWFGPKVFNRKGAEYFIKYQSSLDKWDSIIKPVIQAYQDGAIIKSVEVDYNYHPRQSQMEEDDRMIKMKRLMQYRQILSEIGDPFWGKPKFKGNK